MKMIFISTNQLSPTLPEFRSPFGCGQDISGIFSRFSVEGEGEVECVCARIMDLSEEGQMFTDVSFPRGIASMSLQVFVEKFKTISGTHCWRNVS